MAPTGTAKAIVITSIEAGAASQTRSASYTLFRASETRRDQPVQIDKHNHSNDDFRTGVEKLGHPVILGMQQIAGQRQDGGPEQRAVNTQ